MAELWTDLRSRKSVENNRLLNEEFGGALPLYIVMTPDGREVGRLGGLLSVPQFAEFLKKGLERATGNQ